jgi:hypothetical protein
MRGCAYAASRPTASFPSRSSMCLHLTPSTASEVFRSYTLRATSGNGSGSMASLRAVCRYVAHTNDSPWRM